jgi:hypothetical protein
VFGCEGRDVGRYTIAVLILLAIAAGAFAAARICGGTCPLRKVFEGSGGDEGSQGQASVQLKKFACVVWEAEDAEEIEPPMRKVEARLGSLIGGTGYLEIPDKSNPYEVDKKEEGGAACEPPGCGKPANASGSEQPRFPGRAVYHVEVPEDGEYYFWVRSWWLDSCGDSVFYKIDDGPYRVLTGDPTTRASAGRDVWRWRTELSAGKPRTFRLSRGKHRIELRNREDGPRFDQLMLTTDPSHPGDEVKQ